MALDKAMSERLVAEKVGSGWVVQVRSHEGSKAEVALSHPLSRGHTFIIRAASSSEVATAVSNQLAHNAALIRERRSLARLPETPNLSTLGRLCELVYTFDWTHAEASALGWFLHEASALTQDEAAWVDGFMGVDAPMRLRRSPSS